MALIYYTQDFRVYEGTRDQPMPRPFPAPPTFLREKPWGRGCENWHTFIIRPHLPPLKTGKCLVPGVQLDFQLHLNPNSVYLMGTPNKRTLNHRKFPVIHNDDIKVTLLMRKVTLNASVYVRPQKERQLGKKIVRYPVVRSEIRTFSFDGRTTQREQDNVFVGRFPDQVMVGCCIPMSSMEAYKETPVPSKSLGSPRYDRV